MNYDPWDWTSQQKPVAPLQATLQTSQEQPPPIQVVKDPTAQQANQMVVGKVLDTGINAGAKGIGTAYKVANAAPLAATPEAAASTYGLGADAALGAGSQAAMLAAQDAAMVGAGETAATAGLGLGTSAAASAAPLAAGAAEAGATGLAATNSWNPVGWAAMAYLGGKALKLW